MGSRSARWTWSKVDTVHQPSTCTGEVRSYRYRYYQPPDSLFERCVGLAWCSVCREYSGAMVYVPRDEHLTDVLMDLPTPERERLARSEVKLLDHLDRLARRGSWPAGEA
jgi:hypothetical protein